MMPSPSSPILRKSRSLTPDAAVNISSKLRRNSLVSDHEDMVLLREKLTRIAVGRHHSTPDAIEEEEKERRRRSSSGGAHEHFKVFPLLPPERTNTPPSSPQPRDVLRKQLKLKQRTRSHRTASGTEEDVEGLVMSVDEVEITAMEDVEEDNHAVHSPPRLRGHKRSPQARLSIPGHLRVLSPFSVLNKYPEGLRKRKSVHVDDAADSEDQPRVSLKKTSSQINILASSAGKLSRSSSAGGALFQKFAARQRLQQDQDMEDASGLTTQPQSPQNSLFGNKHGQLSACS
ncbi:hypothetical protein F441_01335 [Phytophthora nicotianae CJ01A1]|uniref:Uncharacterized protein n=6 Tax=Phytophthora nicotianae TaxID=4792 RepID=W2RK68_PHYN3|nr:hypothetical protein PPTG_01167 [Phytophthora nicotianae INRA-310]ETI56030.1 hypothetical protein F443_01358 [Phytophthora nicotianae P1569]ETK95825.1 hypothetical protein L915_01288 [Phytophthora nicotianae]ETP25830.1 hypothetical protein F441_01335 [Phytophthora nicotianae CJ01A1]ETP53807.1 hypothetical protein F442_01296 [Phytophthora nicotianae P10297]ETM02229.1 hypothetical protein L917_01248 [Phytophthora nicotianae]